MIRFLVCFHLLHFSAFLVLQFELEDPVEVDGGVGGLEGLSGGVRDVEQPEVQFLLLSGLLGDNWRDNGRVRGVQVDEAWEEHVLGGQNRRAAKIRFYYTILCYQSFIWT